MAESGFAPAATIETLVPAAAINNTVVAPPVVSPPPSPDILLERIFSFVKSATASAFDLNISGLFVTSAERNVIAKKALKTIVGNDKLASYLSDDEIFVRVRDLKEAQLKPLIAEDMQGKLDPKLIAVMEASRGRLQPPPSTLNDCFLSPTVFLAWLDILVRRALSVVAQVENPTSIIFEIANADAPVLEGVRIAFIWGSERSRSDHGGGIQSASYFSITIPWFGRLALMHGAASEEEVLARRILLVKSIMVAIYTSGVR